MSSWSAPPRAPEERAIRLGFLIDNRRCIGCHACTVACKSEHDVPVGVNRTWVKQVETGVFPDVRRSFHVMRCNHCADSPCTEICPVTALWTRPDGIVDFDNRRCIGCKACMQACPYDALYIDPQTHTAAKCNFCSHRVDRGLQPACVVACPEQAIVSGDLAEPASDIARLVAREPVQVRRPEKATAPSLYYIEGDHAALDPLATAGALRGTATDAVGGAAGRPLAGLGVTGFLGGNDSGRRVYDAPKSGLLWGKEVSGYLWTKALAAGLVAVPVALVLAGLDVGIALLDAGFVASLVMQAATGALLVADLERPDRFLNVLLRGNPRSWLVRGAWILTAYGATTAGYLAARWLGAAGLSAGFAVASLALAAPVAVYTAFLLAQARGRDLWQSPLQPVHMLVHAVVAGAAGCMLLEAVLGPKAALAGPATALLVGGLLADLALAVAEIGLPHATRAAADAARRLHTGRAAPWFWGGVVGGSVAAVLLAGPLGLAPLGALVALGVLFVRNDLWIRAPQEVPLS